MNIAPINDENDIRQEANSTQAPRSPLQVSEQHVELKPVLTEHLDSSTREQPSQESRDSSESGVISWPINLLGGLIIAVNAYLAFRVVQTIAVTPKFEYAGLYLMFAILPFLGLLVGFGILKRSNVARVLLLVIVTITFARHVITYVTTGNLVLMATNPTVYYEIFVLIALNLKQIKSQFS